LRSIDRRSIRVHASVAQPIGKPEATTRSIGSQKSYGNGIKWRQNSIAYSSGNGKLPSN
jgi:hypothetical protein